ncbi:MAG TPA: CARDB domain-containing protein [Thermoleophilaceae bacterium]|nr:CARDB domain-containing protein [Thermoleophilaceae bacterium]
MSSRVSIVLLAGLAAVVALACATASVSGAPAPAADGSVELLECERGKRVADRNALFRGEMSRLPDAASMRMRFELRERLGRNAWRAVEAPGLGVWRHARPDVARFAYRQRIAALARGTAYRVVVEFQWHDAAGMLIERQAARSPVCRQAGPLPNLRVAGLETLAGPTAETVRYVATVVNRGAAPARRLEIALRVDGAEVDTRGVRRVAAHARRDVAFVGPACARDVTVEVDPGDALRERNERDNARSFACAAMD